ncbi:MAG: hypothetical protein LBT82_02940 [Oscillospiraceae bacterium]|jgi:hypothetical protein|nr:hypothetical protein [Oscillospiraceae bacterium]
MKDQTSENRDLNEQNQNFQKSLSQQEKNLEELKQKEEELKEQKQNFKYVKQQLEICTIQSSKIDIKTQTKTVDTIDMKNIETYKFLAQIALNFFDDQYRFKRKNN